MASDDHLYIAGSTISFGAGDQDAVLLKFDIDGNFMEYKLWGSEGTDHVLDLHIRDSLIYLTGKTTSFSESGKFEAFLLSSNIEFVSGTKEDNIDKTQLHLFPNPVGDLLQIRWNSI